MACAVSRNQTRSHDQARLASPGYRNSTTLSVGIVHLESFAEPQTQGSMKCIKSWNALLAGLLLACAAPTGHAQNVAKLLVLPIKLQLDAGRERQLEVNGLDRLSRPIALDLTGVQFASLDTSIAVVSATGLVRGVRGGSTEIEVRYPGAQNRRLPVTVSGSASAAQVATATPSAPTQPPSSAPTTGVPAEAPPAPAALAPISATITPSSILLLPGERIRPSFRLNYADGTQAETGDVVWSAFGAAIRLDSSSREVIGVAPGKATLGGSYRTATTDAVSVTVGEAVLEADRDSLRIVSGAIDTVSLLVPGQSRRRVTQNLTWRTTAPDILRVRDSTAGLVEALDAGAADLIVHGYGVTKRIPVRVISRVAKLVMSPAPGSGVTVATGGTVVIEATATGTAGTPLPASMLTWRIADTSLAAIDARGVVSGMHAGTTRVTLDAPGMVTSSWPLTVAAARVSFGLEEIAVVAGTRRELSVRLRGNDERDFGTTALARFTSSPAEVATVDASGTVTGLTTGRATVIATQPGAGPDSVTVFVTGRGLVSGTMSDVRGIWQLVGPNDSTPTLLLSVDSGSVSQAVWSPDRTRIALTFAPDSRPNHSRVVMIDADGRNWSNLSPDTISASDPSWTKDGTAVLMAGRDPRISSVVQVAIGSRKATVLASGTASRFRFPFADTASSGVLVRLESGGQSDLARLKGEAVVMLTNGKPQEELIAPLRDGRILLAVDSSARSRPSTLQWGTAGPEQVQSPTPVRIPGGLVISDISRGYDDRTVIVVARVRSYPGNVGAALVVFRISLDGADPKVLMILGEKDLVTVRFD